MPELPEILTIKKDLQQELVGKTIAKVFVANNLALVPTKNEFAKGVVNTTIKSVENVGKLVVINLSNKKHIAIHLAMTGRILYNVKDPYIKLTLEFNSKDTLSYSSVRMFGYVKLWDNKELSTYKNKIGPEILNNLSAEKFVEIVSSKKSPIKNVLLDQKVISGIGNIYANDALYLSKINPKIKANNIPGNKLKTLYKNLVKVINEGIEHRGSSIDRYTDIYGKKGWHQDHFYAYKKVGQKCGRCKTPIVFEKIAQRGSFYCPNCQLEEG